MTVERVAYGAGQREIVAQPNLLRLIIGHTPGGLDRDQIAILEANIDDMNPQVFGVLMGMTTLMAGDDSGASRRRAPSKSRQKAAPASASDRARPAA